MAWIVIFVNTMLIKFAIANKKIHKKISLTISFLRLLVNIAKIVRQSFLCMVKFENPDEGKMK
jgi:hypothetical protein